MNKRKGLSFAGLVVAVAISIGFWSSSNHELQAGEHASKQAAWPDHAPRPGDANVPAGKHIKITTDNGDIIIELYPDSAPNTVANFKALAASGFYDGLVFHRVIPGFMAQGGDPEGSGSGGPGYQIKAEFNNRKHIAGTLAMARTSDPDSAGSQFYICFAPQPHLDGQYTVFGQVIQGMDVVNKIHQGDTMRHVSVME